MYVSLYSPTDRLYTVGHYDPEGKWHAESDHESQEDAASRIAFLNGGAAQRTVEGEQDRVLGDGGGISGMTLREWYAGQALAGLLANRGLCSDAIDANIEQTAKTCFAMSDAMIKASCPF